MDEKDNKVTTIPVNSFEEEPNEPVTTDNEQTDVDTEENQPEVEFPKSQPEELKDDAVEVESEPASEGTGPADIVEAEEPTVQIDQSDDEPVVAAVNKPANSKEEKVDWAKKAAAEPAATSPITIPRKKNHKARNIILVIVLLVALAVGAYAVYVFASPKDQQSASSSVAPVKDNNAKAASEDPLSAVDTVLGSEITDESNAVSEQTTKEATAVDDMNKETSQVSGAYDESNF